MRINLPVTHHEYPFPDGATIVSTTDLDSRITYCNAAFVEISGYEREELIGQPHNLVRHPDMPAEAFRDLWETVRSGRPWSGLVKNRRKNGEHYWVVANVTPIVRDGQPVGYMSVRTRPTRDQVEAAEALYARMRGEAEAGRLRTRIVEGCVARAGALAALLRWLRPGLTARMALALGLAAAAGALASALAPRGDLAMLSMLLLPVLALVAGLGAWLHHGVTRPLRRAVRTTQGMAAGDIGGVDAAARSDEVGELLRGLNQLGVNLQAMVNDVRTQCAQVEQAADEIQAAGTDLSARTEAQAASLQETAAAIEQIASTVQQNAGSAGEAHRRAGGAGAIAEEASRVVGEVNASMSDIEKTAARIATINGVIDNLAFQTNILALNAAVEAARAGEQGRGFAVVASEVRSLAQRSTEAAREIKQLIEASRSAVDGGGRLVQAAASTMQQVVSASREVGSLVEGISVASAQQSAGVTQVNAAVAQLDAATQQNAAMVEQSAAAASRLKHQAHGLLQSVQVFRLRGA